MKRGSNKVQTKFLEDKLFKALVENAHEGIVVYDPFGIILFATPALQKITGYRPSEVLGKQGLNSIHHDDRYDVAKAFADVQKKRGKSVAFIQRIRHKKGHYIWLEARLTNFLHIPEINGVVSNFRDVTEKIAAEASVRKTQDLLETINRNLSEGIFMGILQKEFIYANSAFLKIMGYNKFGALSLIKPKDIFVQASSRRKLISNLKQDGAVNDVEVLLRRKNGEEFWGVINVNLLAHEGRGNYFVGSLRDVSREKETQQQLIESKNFFDNIINTAAAPIFIKDDKHRWVMFNDSFCKIMGKSRKMLTGKSDPDFFNAKESEIFWKTDKSVLKTGKTSIQEESASINGKTHHFLTVKSRYINEKGKKFIIGFITEITHLKRAEEEIKHLHENLEGVLESSEESIFSVDKELRYMAFNRRHRFVMKLLYGANIQIGKNKIKFFRGHADSKWVKAELNRALAGHHFVTDHFQDFPNYKGYIQTTYNPIRGEANEVKGVAVFVQDITQRKKYEQIINSINANLRGLLESTNDGIIAFNRKFEILLFNNAYAEGIKNVYGSQVSIGSIFLDMVPPDVAKRLRDNAGKVFKGERVVTENEHPKGLFLETSYNPIYDDKGGVSGVALFIRNITERKRMEERNKILNFELMEQNMQLATQEEELKATLEELSERNFELDQLMYKTSHDLRSPLSSIMGLINLAHLDRDPIALHHYLVKIEGSAKKLDEFIRSMLDYARVNRLDVDKQAIDLHAFVRGCVAELEYMENYSKVKTDVSIEPANMIFHGDSLRLKIIFSNIISNAYKYINEDTQSFLRIKIKTRGKVTHFIFEDNGIGIKDEYIGKIFNMFYRATEKSQGSGLGMYIVKQAVEKLNGQIAIESEHGKGTRIEIQIPNN